MFRVNVPIQLLTVSVRFWFKEYFQVVKILEREKCI